MYFHLIPLQELKRHSVTYWRPGRDFDVSPDTWVVIAERGSSLSATVLELPAPADTDVDVGVSPVRGSFGGRSAEALRDQRAEDVLALYLARRTAS